jgi:hypothetical protein
MNADGKLLQLAAKAAGYAVSYESRYLTFFRGDVIGRPVWDPLNDDGDALRLAVDLKMSIDTDYNGGSVAGSASVDFGTTEAGDPRQATRRAIVRCAAENGLAMLLSEGGAA